MNNYRQVITDFIATERVCSRVIFDEPSEDDFEGLREAVKTLEAPVNVVRNKGGILIIHESAENAEGLNH